MFKARLFSVEVISAIFSAPNSFHRQRMQMHWITIQETLVITPKGSCVKANATVLRSLLAIEQFWHHRASYLIRLLVR